MKLKMFLKSVAIVALVGWMVIAAAPIPHVAYAGGLTMATCPVEMRLLVISADGTEPVLGAIRQTLDYLGTPYDVYIATRTPGGLTANFLSHGCYAFYQGVILTTGELGYAAPSGVWTSALSPAEFETLAQYENAFGIRQVTLYTFPTPAFGFNWGAAVNTTDQPLEGRFTADGSRIFSYLNTSNPLTLRNVYAYLATPLDASTTPLMVDGAGHALIAVRQLSGARENLALTFDGNQNLVPNIALGYGLINWVTRGIFLGEQHTYLSAQVDDVFIGDERWHLGVPCGTPANETGLQYRMDGDDLGAVVKWQTNLRRKPLTANLQLSLAFNGVGTTGIYDPDDLTPAAKENRARFYWISHTHSHPNFDDVTYEVARQEILLNIRVARKFPYGNTRFDPRNLITPEVSGLRNPEFLRAAADLGIMYVVSDTSKPEQGNPSPNTGIVNPIQPQILEIPRRPNNLYYNVAEPEDWVSEYNCRYETFWGRKLSYQEILNIESDTLLGYMLKGDMDPWMFHQTNLAAYDGVHTLLTDLLDLTLSKYGNLYTWPALSPPMEDTGELMKARQAYDRAKVIAALFPGQAVAMVALGSGATVPLTGVNGSSAEIYGGQYISHVSLKPNRPVVLPLR